MDDRTLLLTRHLRASPAQVYAAWTDPGMLPRWFGPEGFSCRTHAIDIRVGGEWRFDMVGHGMTFPNRHRWTELTPHSRIVFLIDGLEGESDVKEVVVTLAPEGEGTRLTQVMTFATPESLRIAEGYGALEKGQETLAKLAALVERQATTAWPGQPNGAAGGRPFALAGIELTDRPPGRLRPGSAARPRRCRR